MAEFVNFTEIMRRNIPIEKKETDFALAALMGNTFTVQSNIGASAFGSRCPVCYENTKDLAFGCGHQTCNDPLWKRFIVVPPSVEAI